MQTATDKITSSPAGCNTRIMAFTELADGEHTVNGKTFTKSGSAFTLDGKMLNAKEIEKATREVLAECGIDKANVRVVDRGALECVIRARVETAAVRAKEAK